MHLSRIALLFTIAFFVGIAHSQDQEEVVMEEDFSQAQSAQSSQQFDNFYNYIIVGGGAAGGVLAYRLSADPNNKVLLIEAGGRTQRSVGGTYFSAFTYDKDQQGNYVPGDSLTIYDVPAQSKTTWANGLADYANMEWNIPSNLGKLSQVKGLGGCQAHNGMQWGRAIKSNVDDWNITGWEWEKLLYYYKKAENVSSSRVSPTETDIHGFDGPVQLTDPQKPGREAQVLNQACLNLGYPLMNDFNRQDDGCGFVYYNIRNGVRDGAAQAYIGKAMSRPRSPNNLHVHIWSQATKVLFSRTFSSKTPYRAVGVRYVDMRTGQTKTAYAVNEVILSGGAILTPHLLWHSGIGPAEVLKNWSIPVLVDNPNVGRHMTNQIQVTMLFNTPGSDRPNLQITWAEQIRYAKDRTGYWAQSASLPWNSYLRTNLSLPRADITLKNLPPGNPETTKQESVIVCITTPKYADGYISLQSADPLVPPYVNQPIFTHQEDVNTLIRGIRLARRVVATNPASTVFGTEINPGANATSDSDLEAWIKKPGVASTQYHMAGTAKMGNKGDKTAVVDACLRVLGVSNLRVADASIIPGGVREKIQATVNAVGEYASDLILQGCPF